MSVWNRPAGGSSGGDQCLIKSTSDPLSSLPAGPHLGVERVFMQATLHPTLHTSSLTCWYNTLQEQPDLLVQHFTGAA